MMRGATAAGPTLRTLRPRSPISGLYRFTLMAAVFSAFLFSPALLYVLGINYAGQGGNPLEKIHFATLLGLVALGLSVLVTGKMRFIGLSPRTFFSLIALIAFATGQLLLLGRPASGLLVTFLTPILLLYLITTVSADLFRFLRCAIMALLIVNSFTGLAEFAFGITLLPHVAGAIEIHGDTRALGLVGHPLTAAFLAGIALVHLVIAGAIAGFRRVALLEIALHGAALLAFGGRLALLAALSLLIVFVLCDRAALLRLPARRRVLIRTALVVGISAGALAASAFGLADQILTRFAEDGGSTATRWAALNLATHLSPDALFFGLAPDQRAEMLAAFDTPYGIEITWIGWLVDYGLFIALALLAALGLILRACLRGGTRVHYYMTAYFLICISGAQGLGAKSLLLAWMVVLLLTLRSQPDHRSAPRNAAMSGPRPAPAHPTQGAPAFDRHRQGATAHRQALRHRRAERQGR